MQQCSQRTRAGKCAKLEPPDRDYVAAVVSISIRPSKFLRFSAVFNQEKAVVVPPSSLAPLQLDDLGEEAGAAIEYGTAYAVGYGVGNGTG